MGRVTVPQEQEPSFVNCLHTQDLPHFLPSWAPAWGHRGLHISLRKTWSCGPTFAPLLCKDEHVTSPSILFMQLVQYLVSESVLRAVRALQANLNAWVPRSRQEIPNSVSQENPGLWGRERLNIYLKLVGGFTIWLFIDGSHASDSLDRGKWVPPQTYNNFYHH